MTNPTPDLVTRLQVEVEVLTKTLQEIAATCEQVSTVADRLIAVQIVETMAKAALRKPAE
jgi:hypothetical protein